MDTITHVVLGTVTAQLGFRRRIGRDATWAAAAAALVPDLDLAVTPMVSFAADRASEFGHMLLHRGLTHSVFLAPVIALAVAGAWWGLRRWRSRRASADAPAPKKPVPFWLLYACVFVAAVSHPLLDWSTAYGTELLAPLTDTRYALGVIAAVDVFFTPLLLLTLLACFIAGKLGRPRAAMAAGWVGFLLAIGYMAAGGVLKERAIAEARPLVGPALIVRADAYPALGSILTWRAVIETDRAWHVFRVRPLALSGEPPHGQTALRQSGPWIDEARKLPAARMYEWFAMGVVRGASSETDGSHVVELHDMRFGPQAGSAESLWPLRITFGASGGAPTVERFSPLAGLDRPSFLKQVWRDVWGP